MDGPGLPDLLPDLNIVRDGFDRFDLLDERVRFLQGDFGETLPDAADRRRSRCCASAPSSAPAVGDVLDALYDRSRIGGFVVIDDYVDPDVAAAVDGVPRSARASPSTLERIDWSGAVAGARPTEVAGRRSARRGSDTPERTGAVAAGAAPRCRRRPAGSHVTCRSSSSSTT